MRDYALSRAASAEATGGLASFNSLLRNWMTRRAVGRLGELDDYLLRDIGITREDVQWASGLPLSVNAALALEDRAAQRRRPGKRMS